MSSSTRIRAQDRFAHVSVAFSSRSKSRTESKKMGVTSHSPSPVQLELAIEFFYALFTYYRGLEP